MSIYGPPPRQPEPHAWWQPLRDIGRLLAIIVVCGALTCVAFDALLNFQDHSRKQLETQRAETSRLEAARLPDFSLVPPQFEIPEPLQSAEMLPPSAVRPAPSSDAPAHPPARREPRQGADLLPPASAPTQSAAPLSPTPAFEPLQTAEILR